MSYLLNSLTTKFVSAVFFVSAASIEIKEMLWLDWNITKRLHATVTSDYIHNGTYSAKWLQPKPASKEKLPAVILSNSVVYFICCAFFKKLTVKLIININYWFSAVRVW